MPKAAAYSLIWSQERERYFLTGPTQRLLLEEQASWMTWLEEHSSFAFHGRNGHLNVLREARRGGNVGYWYAYQRHKDGMMKRYLGRNSQVTPERLEDIAAQMAEDATNSPSGASLSIVPTLTPAFSPEKHDTSPKIQLEPLLMPKFQVPRHQSSLLSREHLLSLLDTSIDYKLTLIAGPAGYGKTTLASQWIAARATSPNAPHIAYLTLDEDDNDPIRFWHYLIAACQRFQPTCGKDTLTLLLAHRLPPFKPLTMMLTALLNALSQLEHPCVLILDDFHAIRSSGVIETLSFFLDHLPTTLHLMILLRGDTPFPLARLRAHNELLDIYPPQFCFSLEDIRAFFKQELSFTLSTRALHQIYEKVDGWPAGLRLLVRDLQRADTPQERDAILAAFAGKHWSIQAYFLNEVLHTLPSEQQDFLLQTSILPRVTASLCDAITGRTDSARLLEALYSNDLFLLPLDTAGEQTGWTRYHTLFAEAMQQEARKQLGDEQVRLLAECASAWYEQHGLLNEAIETALNAGTYTHAVNLIWQLIETRQQHHVLSPAELYTFNRWIERLPEQEIERHPDLCIYAAMTLLFLSMEEPQGARRRTRIYHLLQRAEEQWRETNMLPKLADVFAFRALLARQEGRIPQAVTWAKQAMTWMPHDERWRNLSLTVIGTGELLNGSLTNARQAFLEALALSEQQGNTTYTRATRGMLAGASLEQAELHSAAEQFRQMQAEARIQEDYDDIAHTQLGLAHIAYQWNNLTEAELAAQEALKIGTQMQVIELQAQATAQLARIQHARGQSAQAQQRLLAWLAGHQTADSPEAYQLTRLLQATLASIQLASSNLIAVEHWFMFHPKDDERLPLLQRQHELVLQSRLFLTRGEHMRAIEQLENLLTATQQTGHIHLSLEVQCVLVIAYSCADLQTKASAQLRELLITAQGENYLRLFLDEGQIIADLLHGLLPSLREKALLSYVRHILSAFARPADADSPENLSTATLLVTLSPQERRVMQLLTAGNSNAEIARALVVSVNTVRTHIQSIYRKLNVTNRIEASALGRQQ